MSRPSVSPSSGGPEDCTLSPALQAGGERFGSRQGSLGLKFNGTLPSGPSRQLPPLRYACQVVPSLRSETLNDPSKTAERLAYTGVASTLAKVSRHLGANHEELSFSSHHAVNRSFRQLPLPRESCRRTLGAYCQRCLSICRAAVLNPLGVNVPFREIGFRSEPRDFRSGQPVCLLAQASWMNSSVNLLRSRADNLLRSGADAS